MRQGCAAHAVTRLAEGAPVGAAAPVAVIICPAQFGIRADYEALIDELRAVTGIAYAEVVDLTRLDWLRIIPATLTNLGAYINGTLPVRPTLDFYIEKIDEAVAAARTKLGEGVKIKLVGHSIGGWVTRGFLAERPEVLPYVDLILTLGSPNQPPPADGFWAGLDQTRGLLRECNERFAQLDAASKPRLVSVVGKGTAGGFLEDSPGESGVRKAWDENLGRSPLLEGVVACTSYLALSGEAFGVGDGLIPVSIAAMDDSDILELDGCNHAGFVPSFGSSIILPDTYKWYGSREMVDLWAPKLLRS